MNWSPVAVNAIHIHAWEDDALAVAYNALSGDTHVLDPLTLELIALAEKKPHSAQDMLRELDDGLDATERSLALQTIEETLLKLRDLGILIASAS